MNNDPSWLRKAGWGIFFHFLASPASSSGEPEITVDKWNLLIDAFDVKGLAAQLEEIGAGYFFITLGQNSGYYLSPNETYDNIVSRYPSRCSQRDLIADLWDELSARNIRLLVYLPSNAPIFDVKARERLRFSPIWKDRDPEWCGLKAGELKLLPGVDSRMSQFQRYWEAVITEWSLRWGKKVSGWWIDGCYHPDLMYDFPDEPNFVSFTRAIKSGNSDSLVAYAIKCGTMETGSWSDYTAGEMNHFLPVPGKHAKFGGVIDGAQYHILTFLGEYWGIGKPRFSADFANAWTREVLRHNGAVTWDVPPMKNGLIPEDFMQILERLKYSHTNV
jgi:hypothetical protein